MIRTLGALGLLAVGILAGCESENLCGEAPLCRDAQAINCDPSCTVGPCSNSPTFTDCAADTTTCQIALGAPESTRFFRSRAVCEVNGSEACDPASSPPPTCDGLGHIQGCSAYRQVIVATCASASTFFANPACCSQPFDGGADAGSDGGLDGGSDAGADGGMDGGTDGGVPGGG